MQSINEIDPIYVSTDSQEIANFALKENIKVIQRPLDLAKDHSPEWLSWKHAVEFILEKEVTLIFSVINYCSFKG